MKNLESTFSNVYYEFMIFSNFLYIWLQKRIRNYYPHFESNLTFSDIQLDILIPAIDKDQNTLKLVIEGARQNVFHPILQIFVVGKGDIIRKICSDNDCIFVDEKLLLPINKCDINFWANGKDRSGWIFQQLLKLSGDTICNSENILVLDADTVLIKPTIFQNNNEQIFYFSDEFNVTYFRNYEKLFKNRPLSVRSHVSHMMLFKKEVLKDFRKTIELENNQIWYNAILNSLEINHVSPFSEFECYGNYFNSLKKFKTRYLYSHNASLDQNKLASLKDLEKIYSSKYRSVSFHNYP